jgi:hypothetical protein
MVKAGVPGGPHGGDSRFEVQGKVIQLPRQHERVPDFPIGFDGGNLRTRTGFREKYLAGKNAVLRRVFAISWCFLMVKAW